VDKIDVPAESVFLDQAPASLKPPDVLQDPHKMMLNRLAWEFSQRIAYAVPANPIHQQAHPFSSL
jgi:hypothetical protein